MTREQLRAQVRRMADRYPPYILVAGSLIDKAAALAHTMYQEAERVGVVDADFEVQLASVCLEAVTGAVARSRPDDPQVRAALIAELANRLRQLGVDCRQEPDLRVLLPLWDTTPVRYPLVVTTRNGMWDLYPNTPHTTIMGTIYAPTTTDGAAEVAELLLAINRGEHGNPFRENR